MSFDEDPFKTHEFWTQKLGPLGSGRNKESGKKRIESTATSLASTTKYARPRPATSNLNSNRDARSSSSSKRNLDHDAEGAARNTDSSIASSDRKKAFLGGHLQSARGTNLSLSLAEPFKQDAVKRLFVQAVEDGGEMDDVGSSYDYTDSSDDDDDGSSSDSSSSSSLSYSSSSPRSPHNRARQHNSNNLDAFGREMRPQSHDPQKEENQDSQQPNGQTRPTSSAPLLPTREQYRFLARKLQSLPSDRKSIASLMFWFIKHSHLSRPLFDFLLSSIVSSTCPLHFKMSRLYLLSDILFNSQCGFSNAWQYRALVDLNGGGRLECIIDHFAGVWKGMGRVRAEGLRKSVLGLLAVWEGWGIFTLEYLQSLRQRFTSVMEKPAVAAVVQTSKSFRAATDDSVGMGASSLSSSSSIAASSSTSCLVVGVVGETEGTSKPSSLPMKMKPAISKFKPIDSSVPSGFVPIDTSSCTLPDTTAPNTFAPVAAISSGGVFAPIKSITVSTTAADQETPARPAEKKFKAFEGSSVPIYRTNHQLGLLLPDLGSKSGKGFPGQRPLQQDDDEDDEEDVLAMRSNVTAKSTLAAASVISSATSGIGCNTSSLSSLAIKKAAGPLQMKLAIKSDQARFEGDREVSSSSSSLTANVFADAASASTGTQLLNPKIKKKKGGPDHVDADMVVGETRLTQEPHNAVMLEEWEIDDSILLEPDLDMDGEALTDIEEDVEADDLQLDDQ